MFITLSSLIEYVNSNSLTIIEKEDKFIFLGEAYIPTYKQVRTVDANGKSTYTRVFDGFLYTHAFIIAFDNIERVPIERAIEKEKEALNNLVTTNK